MCVIQSSDSSIRASAESETDGPKVCSGGSGGLIRLRAQRASCVYSITQNTVKNALCLIQLIHSQQQIAYYFYCLLFPGENNIIE